MNDCGGNQSYNFTILKAFHAQIEIFSPLVLTKRAVQTFNTYSTAIMTVIHSKHMVAHKLSRLMTD